MPSHTSVKRSKLTKDKRRRGRRGARNARNRIAVAREKEERCKAEGAC